MSIIFKNTKQNYYPSALIKSLPLIVRHYKRSLMFLRGVLGSLVDRLGSLESFLNFLREKKAKRYLTELYHILFFIFYHTRMGSHYDLHDKQRLISMLKSYQNIIFPQTDAPSTTFHSEDDVLRMMTVARVSL